ncbi:MAG: DUF115 domain-containing protein [Myxococcales bacterium]|nr:DUF115 domain-containing protein [Myxococcales bacterium]
MHGPFFDANMAALQEHRPQLVELASTLSPSSLRTVQDPDGTLNLLDTNNQEKWYTPTVTSALEQLQRREDIQKCRLVGLFGLGLGLELNALLQLFKGRDRTILVVEPDVALFQCAIRMTDLRSAIAHKHVDWQIGQTLDELKLRLNVNTIHARYNFFCKSIAQVVPHGAAHRYPNYVVAASNIFLDSVKNGARMIGNDYNDVLLGLENICHNLPILSRSKSIWAFKDILKGRPAIVASAGPSLQASLPYLKPIQDQVPIFCPDTSIRILQAAGIRPHVATSRERVEMTIRHFENLEAPDTVLACCPVLQPSILSNYQGPLALIFRSADFHQWLGVDEPEFEFGGSAGNLAFRIAALAGCNPIILVGQDLCFAENGNTHAEGTATGNRIKWFNTQPAIEAKGSRGDTVTTTSRWLEFQRQFDLDIADYSGRVINATARGLHIPRTEVGELPELLTSLRKGTDPRPLLLAACLPKDQTEQSSKQQQLLAQIQDTREANQKTRKLLDLGKSFSSQCQINYSPPDISELHLDALIKTDPYQTLDIIRQKVIIEGGDIFLSFSTPIIQTMFLEIEIERYAAERMAKTPTELGRNFIDQYTRWFHTVEDLLNRGEKLLELGEQQLRESLNQLPAHYTETARTQKQPFSC